MTKGGYIFLHDYTTHWLKGIKNAVIRFEENLNTPLNVVPLADRGGTLVIVK